eukprot:CAMPEP_0185158006 /NCGR_PEP_ID=MMETSP1139-20130426/2143_1 /TAXON_ID=298111 /ORGANISM="Pavlova sp., Strain CCMP459" /LENGTH=235 /DNA_ID=CAMNT_0027723121 /DNA_START=106 /DNA_END=816 /DNA_ORIENTATION=-
MDRPNPTTVPPITSALRIKIISVGDPAVGKSCLIKATASNEYVTNSPCQYTWSAVDAHDRCFRAVRALALTTLSRALDGVLRCPRALRGPQFVSKYVATIGVDYGVKPLKVRGKEVRVNFWDLAGGEEYTDIRNEFYKDAQGVLLVFDVNQRKSFDMVELWVNEAEKFGAGKDRAAYVLVGNKTDTERRVVTAAEGAKLAKKLGLQYFETTAKDGTGVQEMFHTLFGLVIEKLGV